MEHDDQYQAHRNYVECVQRVDHEHHAQAADHANRSRGCVEVLEAWSEVGRGRECQRETSQVGAAIATIQTVADNQCACALRNN